MSLKPLAISAAGAAALMAVAVGLKWAQAAGMIGPDVAGRVVQALIGLMLVAFANAIPKKLGAWRGPETARRMQVTARVSGWSFAIAGLVYAAFSAFAPASVGFPVSIGAVAFAVLITLAFAAWACFGGEDRRGAH